VSDQEEAEYLAKQNDKAKPLNAVSHSASSELTLQWYRFISWLF